ncbi:hypothetical protein KAR91_31800 [Candidatus Pacearchaeota archaeon]|nr:hypothetical protein [Candidatus Pacearchaeota archaeon]
MSVDILFKGIDERQGITHASGTIGGFWVFIRTDLRKEVCPDCRGLFGIEKGWQGCACEGKSVHRIRCVYSWVASYESLWRVSIPAGCDSGNGLKILDLVRKRLMEVYPEG